MVNINLLPVQFVFSERRENVDASGVFDLTRSSNFEAHLRRWSRFEGACFFSGDNEREGACKGAGECRVQEGCWLLTRARNNPLPDLASVKNAWERFTFVVQLSRGFPPPLDTDLSTSPRTEKKLYGRTMLDMNASKRPFFQPANNLCICNASLSIIGPPSRTIESHREPSRPKDRETPDMMVDFITSANIERWYRREKIFTDVNSWPVRSKNDLIEFVEERNVQLRAPPQKPRSLSTSKPLYCAFRRCVHWDFIRLLEQTLLHIRGRGNKRDLQSDAFQELWPGSKRIEDF